MSETILSSSILIKPLDIPLMFENCSLCFTMTRSYGPIQSGARLVSLFEQGQKPVNAFEERDSSIYFVRYQN